jgi:tetratricopeptide (TPR) repeat protein
MSVSLWEGYSLWRRGDLGEALGSFETALEQDRMWGGSGIGTVFTRSFLIGVHLDRGDVAAARTVADTALSEPLAADAGRMVRLAVAQLLVAEGRYDEAIATLDATTDVVGIVNPIWHPHRSLRAAALAGLGRAAKAVELAAEEVALLRRWGAPTYLGAGLRRLGELSGGAGLEHLREAVDVLAPTTAVLETARARLALGRSPDVADAEAVPLLQAAVSAARTCGAEGVRDAACAALAERGEPVDLSCADVPVVSPTTRRILDLAATGLDVREVAQRLFLTPGTVRAVLEGASMRP